jgi:thiol-disulfide isomerase/thioredoxin
MVRARQIVFFLLIATSCFAQHQHHQSEKADGNVKPTAILIFMAVDCPVTKKYMNTIKMLASRYKESISVTGYFPAGLPRKTETSFRNEYEIPEHIKLIDDKNHQITKKFGATITPEAFLLSDRGEILYSGAIDNWFFELGRYRPEITENYLVEAIEAALSGKVEAITKTIAIGCFIQQTGGEKKHEH